MSIGSKNLSLRDVVQHKIDEVNQVNSKVSLRGISKRIGIAQSTLSDFLKGKVALSVDTTEKVIHWLGVRGDFAHYLMLTNLYEQTKSRESQRLLRGKLMVFEEGRLFVESKEVEDFLDKVNIYKKIIYVKTSDNEEADLVTRTLLLLENKNDKKKIKSFYELIVDHRNPSLAGGYFLENSNGTFKVFLCSHFQKGHRAVIHDQKNREVEVSFNADGLPHVHSTQTSMMGDDTRLGEYDLIFTKESMIGRGFNYNKKRPSEKIYSEVIYKKVYES